MKTLQEIISDCGDVCKLLQSLDKSELCDLYKHANGLDEEETAKWLCENFELYKLSLERNAVARVDYKDQKLPRDGSKTGETITNQIEKNLAKAIFRLWKEIPHRAFGKVIHYEVPLEPSLNDVRKDRKRAPENMPLEKLKRDKNQRVYPRGRIDLLSVKRNAVYVLELKKKDSVETYLRCLLEAYTYVKTIKRPNEFFAQFGEKAKRRLSRFIVCPLVFESENPKSPYQRYLNRGVWVKRLELMIASDPDIGGLSFYAFKPGEVDA